MTRNLEPLSFSYLFSIAVVLSATAIGCASQALSISCEASVPEQFQQNDDDWEPPNDAPESIRYIMSYEAFWYNCVMVKADDLDGRCLSTCSGTAAASYGCSDGAMNAEEQVEELLTNFDRPEIQLYLQTIATTDEARFITQPYFPDGPVADPP